MKKIITLLCSALLMVSSVQAQEVDKPIIKKVSVDGMALTSVKVYEDKVELDGVIDLKRWKERNHEVVYQEELFKTDIEINNAAITTNDLYIKGKLNEQGVISLCAEPKDFSIDHRAKDRLDGIREILKRYNDDEELKIDYINVNTMVEMLLPIGERKMDLYYMEDDQVLIGSGINKDVFAPLTQEKGKKELEKFFKEDNENMKELPFQDYSIPFKIIVENKGNTDKS